MILPLSLFLVAGSKAQCPGKRFAQRPRGLGLGWARRPLARPRPGAPALSCFVCSGRTLSFLQKRLSAAFNKTCIFMLNKGASATHNEPEAWDVEARSEEGTVLTPGCPRGRLLPRTFSEWGFAGNPGPCSLRLSRVWPWGPGLCAGSGLCFIPATGWVPQKASPVKLKLRSHCVFSLLVAFCPGRIHNLHFL